MGGDGNCLFYCYAFLIQQRYSSLEQLRELDTTTLKGTVPKLPTLLLDHLKNKMTDKFFDLATNGVYQAWKKKKKKLSDPLDVLAHFGMFCDEYDQPDGMKEVRKANAEQIWKDAMKYQPKASKTRASKDYDPFDGDKNYNENRMPNSQEPFHFAFCNMCNTTLVVYTQFLSCQFRTEIYCSQPTDKNIYV